MKWLTLHRTDGSISTRLFKIDTSYKDDDGNTIWNNIEVHSALRTLKSLVKDYYNKEIVPTLFKYEFLK